MEIATNEDQLQEQPSISFELIQTQDVCTQIDAEEMISVHAHHKKAPEQLWGRLMPLGGQDRKVIPLMPRGNTPGSSRFNLYKLGRSTQCDFLSEDRRVSGMHCTIYCEKPALAGQPLEVYIDDCSANGTWINGTIRLRQERRLLNTGDEICLINPDNKENDVQVNSLTFINLSGRVVEPRSRSLHRIPTGFIQRVNKLEHTYETREILGHGNSGKVFRVIHRLTGQEFAVKTIETKKFQLCPGLSPEQIIQEAMIMKHISHPYIVQLHEIFETDSEIQLVMDLVKGGDLFDRIVSRTRFSEYTARECFYRILVAVQYLHSEGICHRDLKPENILMVDANSDIDIKITDFGLAKKANREGLKTFCGTPQYFAPEVLKRRNTVQGAGRYGMEADMWSLGVILFILLSGGMPFNDDTLFTQIQNASFNFDDEAFQEVSLEAKHLIRMLLCSDPKKRYSADQALKHPWMMNREDGMGISLSQAPASEGFVRGQRADDVLCTPLYDTDGGSDPELPHRNTSAAPFQDTQSMNQSKDNIQVFLESVSKSCLKKGCQSSTTKRKRRTPSLSKKGHTEREAEEPAPPSTTNATPATTGFAMLPMACTSKKAGPLSKPAVSGVTRGRTTFKHPTLDEIQDYSSSEDDAGGSTRKKVVIRSPEHWKGLLERKTTASSAVAAEVQKKFELLKMKPPETPVVIAEEAKKMQEPITKGKSNKNGKQQTITSWFVLSTIPAGPNKGTKKN